MLKYRDKVRITKGFYQDCVGILVGYNIGLGLRVDDKYDVEIGKGGRIKTITITADFLELKK